MSNRFPRPTLLITRGGYAVVCMGWLGSYGGESRVRSWEEDGKRHVGKKANLVIAELSKLVDGF